MSKNTPKRLFTVKEAAHYLGLRPRRIYEAKRKGATDEARERFPVPARKTGNQWFFELKDLDAYADSLPYDGKGIG